MIGPNPVDVGAESRKRSIGFSGSRPSVPRCPALLTSPRRRLVAQICRGPRVPPTALPPHRSTSTRQPAAKSAPYSWMQSKCRSPPVCAYLPITRKPRSSSSFAAAHPLPVDAPVMTTDRMHGLRPNVRVIRPQALRSWQLSRLSVNTRPAYVGVTARAIRMQRSMSWSGAASVTIAACSAADLGDVQNM